MTLTYDVVARHQAIEKLVTCEGLDGQGRKYYRFRPARWYGGIITADCVGCGLLCRFCWVSDRVMNRPWDVGRFYNAQDIADTVTALAGEHRIQQLRVSGGEPTLGKTHLLQLLDRLKGRGYTFILETNGIPVAYDPSYANDLSRYDFIHVRVSLKGCNEEEFTRLTGGNPEGFTLQLEALENLVRAGVSCHPSVMASFSTDNSQTYLVSRLGVIDPKLAKELEVEELILYPHVVRRLQRAGLRYYVGHKPDKVPPNQV